MKYRLEEAHDHLNTQKFHIAVRQLADSLNYGADRSAFLGAGLEYVQSRIYEPGDPIKYIDWRVTARTGKVYVKEFESPKQMPFYLLIDTSASMCISSQRMSKYAWAVQLGTGLALAAQNRMSPVGLLGCGERDFHVRPTLSKGIIYQAANELRHYNFQESTSLGESLRELAPSLPNKSVLIILSDLHDDSALSALKVVAQKHDVAVFQLMDPAERGKLRGGIFRGREAESGHTFIGHGRSKWFDVEAKSKELRRAGVDHLLLPTDQPFVAKVRNFLKDRDCFGKGR